MKSFAKPPKMYVLPKTEPKKEEKKEAKPSEVVIVDENEDTRDIRPSINFTETMLPQIKDWKIGQKYKVVLEIEQKSIQEDMWGDNRGKMSSDFRIVAVGEMPSK